MSKGDIVIKAHVEMAIVAWMQVAKALHRVPTMRKIKSIPLPGRPMTWEAHGVIWDIEVLNRVVEITSFTNIVSVVIVGYNCDNVANWKVWEVTVMEANGRVISRFRYKSPWTTDPFISGYPQEADLWDEDKGVWVLRQQVLV